MTPIQTARELLAAAIPGPWSDRGMTHYDIQVIEAFGGSTVCTTRHSDFSRETSRANAALIAAAPTLIAELCDEVERLQAENTRLREALTEISNHNKDRAKSCGSWCVDEMRDIARAALAKGVSDVEGK